MARPRDRLPWRYDDQRQEFVTAAGIVTLHELASLRYGLTTSHIDLAGPWTGWRIRGAQLKSPRGVSMSVNPNIAMQFGRWLREMDARDASAFGGERPARRPLLYVVK